MICGINVFFNMEKLMMKIQEPVKQETKKIAVGVFALAIVMMLVFAAVGRFDMSVVWGTLLGGGFAILNFFLMALSVQHAANQMDGVVLPPEEDTQTDDENSAKPAAKEELPQQKAARSIMQRSYMARMLLTACIAVLAVKSPVFNSVAAIAALFFPRAVITVQPVLQRFQKEREEK